MAAWPNLQVPTNRPATMSTLPPPDFSAAAEQAPATTLVPCLPDAARQAQTYAEPDGWILLAAIVVCAAGRLAMGPRS